jgi:hypothetical protein
METKGADCQRTKVISPQDSPQINHDTVESLSFVRHHESKKTEQPMKSAT